MAAPSESYIDPADGATNGNDHGGAAFVDGSFANATNTLTKVGAFTAATVQAGDKIYLDDNGSGQVTAGLYTVSARTDDDNIVLTADIRSGAPDPVDVRCDQHDGTINLAWATVQHALDFTTRDAANGDRFNVKAGTDDVLAAALDFTTYGTPAFGAPWILQGYTTAAADGGIGGVSGGGAVGIVLGDSLDYLYFIDMHLHNTGAVDILSLDNGIMIANCEIDNTSANGTELDLSGTVINCHFHNIGGKGIVLLSGTVAFCTLENGANDFDIAIQLGAAGVHAWFNVISIDGSSDGIESTADDNIIAFNSIYANAGTGKGIRLTSGAQQNSVFSNIVEGISGGGQGILLDTGSDLLLYGHNAFYNNIANLVDNSDFILVDLTANDIALAASAFIDAANDDFRIKPTVKALAYPTADYPSLAVRSYLDIGALQSKSQMLIHPGMSGGARA